MRKLVALASFVIAACIVPIPNSAGATCLTESECSALLAIMEPNIQVLRGKVATSNSNARAANAARYACNALDASTVALAEAKNNCINIATDASLSAAEVAETATAKLQEAIDQQAAIRSQLTKIVNGNAARDAAAADKAAADKAAADKAAADKAAADKAAADKAAADKDGSQPSASFANSGWVTESGCFFFFAGTG